MNLFALTIGTDPFQQAESACVPAAARTVVAAAAGKHLSPAAFAEVFVGLTNASLAVDAHRRPKQMIQTLQCKADILFELNPVHPADYTNLGSTNHSISNQTSCYPAKESLLIYLLRRLPTGHCL